MILYCYFISEINDVKLDLLWKISFSWAEQHLVRNANQGNPESCRKLIFKLLKHFLEETKRAHPEIQRLSSYHIKMFMLHQYDSWSGDGELDEKVERTTLAIKQLLSHLKGRGIKSYFIPTDIVTKNVPQSETDLYIKTLELHLKELNSKL